jgi:hypothetical protein
LRFRKSKPTLRNTPPAQKAEGFLSLSVCDMCKLVKQIYKLLWNITIQAADMTYTDTLEFYAAVREGSKHRIDAAE